MMKILNKIKPLLALSVIAALAGIPAAKAAVSDWMPRMDVGASSSASAFAGFEAPFVSQINGGQDSDEVSPAVASDGFLTAQNSPTEPSDKNVTETHTVQKADTKAILQELTVIATAYSSTPDQTDDSPFITASGTRVRDGIVAANFLPFGTKIKISNVFGDKIFVVEDRMHRRFSKRIDVWFPDRDSANRFGLKIVKIQIL